VSHSSHTLNLALSSFDSLRFDLLHASQIDLPHFLQLCYEALKNANFWLQSIQLSDFCIWITSGSKKSGSSSSSS